MQLAEKKCQMLEEMLTSASTYSSMMVLHYAKYDANVEMHLCIVAYRLSNIHNRNILGQFPYFSSFGTCISFGALMTYHEYPECLVIVPTVVATTSVGPFLQFILVHCDSSERIVPCFCHVARETLHSWYPFDDRERGG